MFVIICVIIFTISFGLGIALKIAIKPSWTKNYEVEFTDEIGILYKDF